jgi:hypothetical protein
MSVVTIERIERGLAVCAYLVVRDGPVVAPLFEKLERDLEALRATEDTVIRAKHLLETYSGIERRAIAPPDSSEQQKIQNLVASNLQLPRYVERTHRNGILSFLFRVGRVRIFLPNDPTTSEFRAAYSAALVEAAAAEADNDEGDMT